MFDHWKRRRTALERGVAPRPAEPGEARAGGVDGAGPASAGPAEAAPPDRDAPGSTRARRHGAEERAQLLSELASSGLSPEDFAAQHGVAYSTLRRWQRRASGKGERKGSAPSSRRFTPEERRAAVEAFAKSGRSREDFAKLWGCSASSLDKWRKRYATEGPKGLETRTPPKGRRAHHPKRISSAVRDLIAEVRAQHDDFGVTRVADYLRRFHGVQVSPSTVRNVLREKGVPAQPSPKKRPRRGPKPPRRFERARPGELWQSDITSYVLRRQGRRVYLTVFLDDHSRFIVAWALATHQRTPLVTEPLLEGIARFGKPREVLTDQGRQYYAWRGKSGFQKLLAKEGLQHVVSRAHHPETLGKCERLWKTVADEFWDRAAPEDLEDARRRLALWIRHYNFFRPHQGIDGLVPADRFFDAESTLRSALERELSGNELRLAIDEAPRQPVYLVGQIGAERIALHGERGRLVIDTPDGGRRELGMDSLGIDRETKNAKEASDGERREDPEGEPQPGLDAEAPRADGTQALGLQEGPEAGLAGAGTVGGGAAGGAQESARDVHEDPGVLAGEEGQGGGGGGAVGDAAAGLAALAAGALGDDGGAPDAAAAARDRGRLPEGAGRVAGGAEEADREAGEGAVEDRGPGARAADCPVAEPESGVSREGRQGPCTNDEGEAGEGSASRAYHARPGNASRGSCGRRISRGRRVWRWLKRME